MMTKIIWKLSVLLLMLSSCKKDTLRGEGNISTQKRDFVTAHDFHTIKVNGSTRVFIEAGSQKSLAVKGYDNLLNAYSTEVKNSVLTVGFKNDYIIKNDNVEVYITYPFAPNIGLNGSSEAYFMGDFPFKEEISASINGSGNINYDEFVAGLARFNISGSGNIDAINILAKESNIRLSGSGEVRIAVTDKLIANISGSGNIYYKGNPVIEMDISGSGKIIPLK